MNLFRSEEHIRNWRGYKPGTEEGINKLPAITGLFSGELFTRRLDPGYASHMQEYLGEFVKALNGLGPFWKLPRK
ncbi:MAG: hypothetical protein C4519_06890 [Desulfobacteraceae bacterium]|nr:MAG: hypothetical protein C4519_06890 [Desulfobacteraceae bacterium]